MVLRRWVGAIATMAIETKFLGCLLLLRQSMPSEIRFHPMVAQFPTN